MLLQFLTRSSMQQRTMHTGALQARVGRRGAGAVPLVQLDLEGNEIGDNGTEDLAEALLVMPNLQVLKFAGNRPAFEGTQAIMNSVGTLSALQVRLPSESGV
ncbi:MAG: hypothetical protein HC767_08000 [Akkermansiaceae bacterium]|nr:hypothetical protein [Akkermansiaceae bacterium]